MKHWTLTSLQTRLIKTGGRLVRHARRLVFQLAEGAGNQGNADRDTGNGSAGFGWHLASLL